MAEADRFLNCYHFMFACSLAEFERLVQRSLAANAGMDYAGLGTLLRCIARRSLHQLAAVGGSPRHEGAPPGQLQEALMAAGREEAGSGSEHQSCPSRMVADDGFTSLKTCNLSSPWHHMFRLQRVAAVLRDLVAEQRHLHNGCQQLDGEAALPHAAELDANSACLAQVERRLRELGVEVL